MSIVAVLALAILPTVAPESLFAFTYREVHLGMEVRVTGYAPNDSVARAAARAAFAEVARLEDIFSDWRGTSEVRRLAQRPGEWQSVSPELSHVLSRALAVAQATDGAFDPTVGPLSLLWREARARGQPPGADALARARSRVGYRQLALDPARHRVRLALDSMRLDLGGIAKGFILQRALWAMGAHGVPRALLEAGGDLVAGEAPPGRAGWSIDAPFADRAMRAALRGVRHAAVATSGPTEQYLTWEGRRFSHVIDPRTGLGATNEQLAIVVGSDAALVDAVATSLSLLSETAGQLLLRRFGLSGSVGRAEPPADHVLTSSNLGSTMAPLSPRPQQGGV